MRGARSCNGAAIGGVAAGRRPVVVAGSTAFLLRVRLKNIRIDMGSVGVRCGNQPIHVNLQRLMIDVKRHRKLNSFDSITWLAGASAEKKNGLTPIRDIL